MNSKFLIFLFISILFIQCKNTDSAKTETDTAKTIDYSLPEWAKDAVIYEVNLRQFSEEGTINAFAKDLPRLQDMGVDILWFMPIFPISDTKKKGELGSYYSVSDFLAVNPEFGTMEDMDAMIKKIHDLDMKIILDWVPNHTGWDHVWLEDHKDWFTQNDEGEVIDPVQPNGESWGWTDVADLNYDSDEMRAEMIDQLVWWVKEKDIDGYRMDVAHGIPDDFWPSVRHALYPIKDIFMLAESDMPVHRNDSTFHSTYAWPHFHMMNEVAKGEKSVEDFKKVHDENQAKFNRGADLYFTSNHDENAWNGTVFERLGEGHKGWAVVMALIDGFPLLYSGMEEPMKKRLEFFKRDPINFKDYAYQDFYKHLFTLKKENPALWNAEYSGSFEWVNTDEHVLAFQRKKDNNSITVFFNTSDQIVNIENELLMGTDVTDIEGKTIKRDSNTATLSPYQYLIIKK